ncbi:MAG TPA: hypothetical protein VH853_13495 [Polyangia bacterium]|nr:hypothetical protein [Polyangia bacterium]
MSSRLAVQPPDASGSRGCQGRYDAGQVCGVTFDRLMRTLAELATAAKLTHSSAKLPTTREQLDNRPQELQSGPCDCGREALPRK